MGARSVAEMVCRIASDFNRIGTVSVLDLLRSSGYLQDPIALLEYHLEDVLRSYPELIDEWLRFSEDKRESNGWYLLRPSTETAEWIVGHYPKGLERRFLDRFKGCAFFVKQEIEAYRSYIQH
jgi:hypothetical protein